MTESNSTTGRIQQVSLSMLRVCIDICDRAGVPYFLAEGSLLGAVRHQGFIPWDDDLDIAIPRPFLDAFVRAAKASLPDNMYLEEAYAPRPDGTMECLMKLRCTDFSIETYLFEQPVRSHPWLDIFLLEGMPAGRLRQRVHFFHVLALRAMIKFGKPDTILVHKPSNEKGFSRFLVKLAKSGVFTSLFNANRLYGRLRRCLDRYAYDESACVFVHPSWYQEKEIMPRVWYGAGQMGTFEGLAVRLPDNPDAILAQLYGDYMTPPPEGERKGTHRMRIVEK